MKIACTAKGVGLDSPFDKRFGRAEMFIIYDTTNNTYSVIDNKENIQVAQGAGIKAAQIVIDSGANILITGHLGPKAAQVILDSDLEAYQCEAETVREAIDKYRSNKLKKIEKQDYEG
jgi:predicted Fe-Mo cluster-binding NifX family protein